MKKICISTILTLSLAVSSASAAISDVTISKGVTDRVFDADRTLYNVILPENTTEVPEITATGGTVTKVATTTNEAESPANVTVVKDDETGVFYRFVFKGGKRSVAIKNAGFSDDRTVSITFTGDAKGMNVIVLKPSAEDRGEVNTIDSVVEGDNATVYDVVHIDTNTTTVSYSFPAGTTSGMYNFYIGGRDIDAENVVAIPLYYAAQEDIDQAIVDIKRIIVESPEDELNDDINDFILSQADILKLDAVDYDNLDDKSMIYSAVSSKPFADAAQFRTVFNDALSVSVLNESTDKNAVVDKYVTVFGIDLEKFDDVTDQDGVADMLGNSYTKPSEVKEAFNEAVAVMLINEAEPADILELLGILKDDLKISASTYKKVEDAKDKSKIINALKFKGFESGEDLRDALDGAVKSTTKPSTSTPSGGGSSSGGFFDSYKTDSLEYVKPEAAERPVINAPVEKKEFADMADAAWATEAVNALVDKGIINGKSETEFAPNDYVTREEFVKMLVLALKVELNAADSNFSDVLGGDWFKPYVDAAFEKGIVRGQSDAIFGTGENIIRQDMAIMIYNAANAMDIALKADREMSSFEDAKDISDYALESVEALYKAGVINGSDNGCFEPVGYSTRAMAAQVIYNLLNNI